MSDVGQDVDCTAGVVLSRIGEDNHLPECLWVLDEPCVCEHIEEFNSSVVNIYGSLLGPFASRGQCTTWSAADKLYAAVISPLKSPPNLRS